MKKVSSFVLCGVVACVAMLAGCVADDGDDAAVEEDGIQVLTEPDQKEGASSDVEIAAFPSFALTCTDPEWYPPNPTFPTTSAWASSCRRRNGTWTGPREWHGFCVLNVSNDDGEIVCR